MADDKSKNSGKKPNIPIKPGKKGKFNFYWIYAIMFFIIFLVYIMGQDNNARQIDDVEFEELMYEGVLDSIVIVNSKQLEIFVRKEVLDEDPKYEKFKPKGLFGSTQPQYSMVLENSENFIPLTRALEREIN